MIINLCRQSRNLSASVLKRHLTTQNDGNSVTATSQKTLKGNDLSTSESDVSSSTNDVSTSTNDVLTSKNDISKTTNVRKKPRTRPLPPTTDEYQRQMREDFYRRESDWEKLVDFEKLTEDEKLIHQCHKEAIQGDEPSF